MGTVVLFLPIKMAGCPASLRAWCTLVARVDLPAPSMPVTVISRPRAAASACAATVMVVFLRACSGRAGRQAVGDDVADVVDQDGPPSDDITVPLIGQVGGKVAGEVVGNDVEVAESDARLARS